MIIIILIVLIPILTIGICVTVFSYVRALINRITFYKKIIAICDSKNYKITFPRKLLASFFRYSDKPDIIIKTFDNNYLIRFITCRNKSLFYNFPTSEWYVSFERVLSAPFNLTGKFKHLPKIDKLYFSSDEKIENKCIIIFAPYLPKVSFLNENSAKRELVGNSINIEDWTVYNIESYLKNL